MQQVTVSVARRVALIASSDVVGPLSRRLASAPHLPLEAVEVASLAEVRGLSAPVDAVLFDLESLDGHELDLVALAEVGVPVVAMARHCPEPLALDLLRRGVAEVVTWDEVDVEPLAAGVRRATARAQGPPVNVLDALPVGVLWKDRTGRIRGANRFVAELSGVGDPSWLIGRRDEDMPWGRHAERHRSDDRLLLATGLPLPPYEERMRAADGRRLTIEIRKSPLLDRAGELDGSVAVLRDVTGEQSDAHPATTRSDAVEAADAPIVAMDREGRILYANAEWLDSNGYALEDVTGSKAAFLRPDENAAEEHERLWATILSGDVWQGRLVNRTADGSEYLADHVIAPVRSPSGGVEGFLSVGVPVMRGAGFHERVAGARRMEALGRLSAGVAHDFNNLLGVVLTSSDLLARALEREGADRALLDDVAGIRTAAESGRDLVSALLAYSRRARIRPVPTDLPEAVAGCIPALESTLHRGETIRYAVSGSVPEVLVDHAALGQMLHSLVSNAREAMPAGGEIRVAVEAVVVDDSFVARRYWARPGLYAEVRISDDGAGIEAEALDLIFDPFFSTKGPAGSRGLGLARVFGLVKQHGGYVYADSEPGVGTTAHLLFPGSGPGARERRAESLGKSTGPSSRTERAVLYVEDNDALRRAGCRVLEAAGFKVHAARNGLEALELFEAHRAEIRVVVSDLLMPEMGGGALYRALVDRYGSVPFVLTTAHVDDGAQGTEHVPDHVPYLLKPWAVRDLLDAVNRVLR